MKKRNLFIASAALAVAIVATGTAVTTVLVTRDNQVSLTNTQRLIKELGERKATLSLTSDEITTSALTNEQVVENIKTILTNTIFGKTSTEINLTEFVNSAKTSTSETNLNVLYQLSTSFEAFAKSNPNVIWQVGEVKSSADNGLEVTLSAKVADLEASGTLKISGTSTTDIRTTNEETTANKTDQEKVSEYALNLSISTFEVSEDKTLATLLTEVNAAEGAAKLELLKSASSLLTFYLNALTGVEVTVSQATSPIENRLSASVSLKLNEATANSTINLIPKTAEKTEAEKDATVSDRATIDAITKALNAQTFKSAKSDIKSGLVYADYLLKSQTNEEKLNLVKEYVTTLPSELKAEMIISLVIAQPSQFSDKLTVEIVFAKGNQLGVSAFVIEGFINTKEQFNSYWKNVSDTFDTNPLTIKEQISAKNFSEKIKDLDTANKIYELAKLVNGDDANTKNSFAELVTPIPTQYGAIKNIDFVYNEASVESEAGSFSITITTKFDNVDQSAQLKVTGFLSVNAENDINKGNNGEGEAKSDQEQGALDKEELENLLTVNMFNLKSGIGISKLLIVLNKLNQKIFLRQIKLKNILKF
ncbi:hypothetical protein CJJ23_02435 [Mycoplasmopsis agassizii]|uniref:Lipoprotein associated domain-containing protein n=1 Tax=Mycoplasmopsis agassizii TaxID=33922 RepID=A0A269TKS2_9BACT|nr:hypothetical protein [Mycoplasmopsis agassizii]PAK21375.1 hypothetical protein CJJ23_02435 [Mycoplasmopsis agassizii]